MEEILELGSFLSLLDSPRSPSGRGLSGASGGGTPPTKMSGKVDS